MIDISVTSLVKSFEIGENVLDGFSLTVNSGERVGILGPNGCGKTTLFRILCGELDYDEGQVYIPPSRRVGMMSQIPRYPEEWTTEDVLRQAHRRQYEAGRRMEELAGLMEHDQSPALLAEYDRLSAEFERLGGYSMDSERGRVAGGLRITAAMREQPFNTLSGGEQTLVNLARLILEDTDILLLDEPTNHLDMKAIQWLEDFLLHFKGTVLTISHDRYFLDRVVNRCVEIAGGRAETYSGNYSFYLEERLRRFEERLRRYEKDQAKIAQLTHAAEKMHLWAFMGNDKLHRRAFSMEKRIDKLKETEKPVSDDGKIIALFGTLKFYGDEVLSFEHMTKLLTDKRYLYKDINLKVYSEDRIAVIGDNGSGKSTLMNMIYRMAKPSSGNIRMAPQVRATYLPQSVQFFHPEMTMLDVMMNDCGISAAQARDRLARFGFKGDDVFTPVVDLSGGEQKRLRLCSNVSSMINLLLLDEPTNHLDMASREWLEDAVANFDGTLIFVSHDRYFIEKFANRFWCVGDGSIKDFRGTYQEYLAWWERQELYAQVEKANERKSSSARGDRKKPRPESTEKKSARIEKEIDRLEAQVEELDEQAAQHYWDYELLMELEKQKEELNRTLLELYEKWEELNS